MNITHQIALNPNLQDIILAFAGLFAFLHLLRTAVFAFNGSNKCQ